MAERDGRCRMSEAKRLLGMKDVQERLSIGRSTAFVLVASGQLRSVRIGRRRLVPVAALDEYVAELSR
jgi:excisionase family DNA binding protein